MGPLFLSEIRHGGQGAEVPVSRRPDLGSSQTLPLRGVSSVSEEGTLFLKMTVTLLSLEASQVPLGTPMHLLCIRPGAGSGTATKTDAGPGRGLTPWEMGTLMANHSNLSVTHPHEDELSSADSCGQWSGRAS